ncbi:MAG: hypothetical protein Q9221_003537 [Calogaya cf. arnoldii]
MPTSNDDSFKARRRFTRRAHKRDRSVSPEAEGASKQGGTMLPKRSRMMSALELQSPIDGDCAQACPVGLPTGDSAASQSIPARSIKDSDFEYHDGELERTLSSTATSASGNDSGPTSSVEVRSENSGTDRAGNINEDQLQVCDATSNFYIQVNTDLPRLASFQCKT